MVTLPQSLETLPASSADWPPARQGTYALAVLIIAFAFSFLDRVILSMVMVPIQREMAFSDTQLALLHGFAFVVFFAIAGFPLGRMADTHSRRGLVLFGVVMWSLCTAACAFATNFATLFLARVGVGVGEAALSPAAVSLLADFFRPHLRSRAIAIYQLGVASGAGIAFMLGGLVISYASGTGGAELPIVGLLSPWRLTFLAVGLPGFLVALLVLTIREPTRRQESRGPSMSILPWIRQNRRTVASLALGYASINIAFNALIAWAPTWLARYYGLGPAKTGLALGVLILLGGGTGQVLGGLRSDRRVTAGQRDAVFGTGILCAAAIVPMALLLMLPSLGVGLAMIGGILFAACAAIGHAPSVIPQIAPNRMRGQLTALFLAGQNVVGGGLGSLTVALLTDYVFRDHAAVGKSIALTGAGGAAIGALILYTGRKALDRSARAAASAAGE